MFALLLKKQLAEVFRTYWFDAKHKKMRSKLSVALFFVFFVLVMIGIIGGMFCALSLILCEGLSTAGMGWLYFFIMGSIALVVGVIGGVFTTYGTVYLGKDNDLLLSLPIPVKTIVASRMVTVLVMSAIYTLPTVLPALGVYWVIIDHSLITVLCGLAYALTLTSIATVLSCLLGWIVAKFSTKLKNKSFVTVLLALGVIVLYYVVYFWAYYAILDVLTYPELYGETLYNELYALYLFGSMATGHVAACLGGVLISLILLALVWYALSQSFLGVVTAQSHGSASVKTKAVKQRSVFGALLVKELRRFGSSATYMLNCGLGVIFMPLAGVLLIVNADMMMEMATFFFEDNTGIISVGIAGMFMMLTTMNNPAVPSVSLEGKSIWIVQSLPLHPKSILRAKAAVQVLVSLVPLALTLVCMCAFMPLPLGEKVFIAAASVAFACFCIAADVLLGVKMANLTWSNKMMPIKQSGSIFIALFGSWAIAIVYVVVYVALLSWMSPVVYMGIWTLIFGIAGIVLQWLVDTVGARHFGNL